jgi:hypothetical protein
LSRVGGHAWRIIKGSDSDDWIYWRLLCTITLSYSQYSAIAELLTFRFTVVHALRFSVSASRFLATYLNTETSISSHYGVILLFPTAANSGYSTQFPSDWTLHGNSTASSPI